MIPLETLIEHWQNGDERAAESIYAASRGTTFALARALLDNPSDAEEVTQDVLVYALSHIHQFDPQRARFSTWLHTITVSRCRNRQRRRLLPSISLFSWHREEHEEIDPSPDLPTLAIQKDTRDEVWSAIQRLTPLLREAIVLRYWADFTFEEIAAIVGCPLRTAQSRVRLAHRELKNTLTANENASEMREKNVQASE
jgi:RNA polymerase sigma-70 factor (ECF subfamily)